MNKLFVILFLVSAGVACVLYKKIGLLWSLAILLALPLVLFIVAIVLLILGGDR